METILLGFMMVMILVHIIMYRKQFLPMGISQLRACRWCIKDNNSVAVLILRNLSLLWKE